MSWSDRPRGLVLWERADLPDTIQTASDDAFHHFEVLPLDHYTGGAYEVAEQLLEQTPAGVAERVEQRLQEDFETMQRQWEREPHGASGAGEQTHPEP